MEKLRICGLILIGLSFLALFTCFVISFVCLYVETVAELIIVMMVLAVMASISMLTACVLIILYSKKIYKKSWREHK